MIKKRKPSKTRQKEEADWVAGSDTRLAEQHRLTRNNLLAETDWMASSDLTMSDEWKNYRQALRDLPANTTDPFDVTWPNNPDTPDDAKPFE